MTFEPFQNFLSKAAQTYGIKTELTAAKICHDFKTMIPELFKNLGNPALPACLPDGRHGRQARRDCLRQQCESRKACLPVGKAGLAPFSPGNFIAPAYFKGNTLVVNVENSAWAQEVIIRKPKIIEEMNRKAGKSAIKSLTIQIAKREEIC